MITRDMITKMDDQKRSVRKKIYVKIYEQFCRKIQHAVAMNQKQVFLQVPPFLLGYPSYSLEQAATYLKRQLERSGFDAILSSPISLFVTWFPQAKQVVPVQIIDEAEEDVTLPSLINLKKAANKYRSAH